MPVLEYWYVRVQQRARAVFFACLRSFVRGHTFTRLVGWLVTLSGRPHQCGTIAAKTLPWYRRWYAGDPTKMGEPRNGWEQYDTNYVNGILP